MLEKAFSELFCNFQGILALKNLSCRLKRLIEGAIRAKSPMVEAGFWASMVLMVEDKWMFFPSSLSKVKKGLTNDGQLFKCVVRCKKCLF